MEEGTDDMLSEIVLEKLQLKRNFKYLFKTNDSKSTEAL
jgi:hypothetical protein